MKRNIALAFFLLSGVAYLTGCSNRPTSTQLDAWRQDASAQNAKIKTLQARQAKRDWQFTLQGQTATGKPVQLSLAQLEALAKESIWTTEPHNTKNSQEIVNFRGVAVSKLLDKFGVAPEVTEVTFMSYDGYRATVNLSDLRQYPIIIALERNNQPLSRSDGGPLYLVFPYTQFPQLQQKYPDRFWAFYLTDMVVGTEPIRLQVGKRVFDASALAKLPQVTIDENVGYRIGWPVGKVKLYGVRLRNALAAAGLTLPQDGAVIVQGKSPIYRNNANPVSLEASDVNGCDILLATHWDDDRKPIPAKMGGPITLALSSTCQQQSDERRWVTFVEKLEMQK
ncbi:MAG TPA: molybdopterin-dependent oxidoreductase [Allocoleopsis sp.]